MLTNCICNITINAPAGEGEEGFEVGFVPDEVEVCLFKVAEAVDAVYHHDGNPHSQCECSIELEFVEVANGEQVHNEQFEGDVEYLHIGIHVHFLVGDDGGVVWHLRDAEHCSENAELIHPMGGFHSVGRNVELVAQKPESNGFGKYEYHYGDDDMHDEGGGESFGEALFVAFTELKGKESAGGAAHGGVEETHHCHHAAYHAINAVVFHAESGEHHSRCVEPHQHADKHANVEHDGVFGYAFVVGCGVLHCVWGYFLLNFTMQSMHTGSSDCSSTKTFA